MTGVFPDSLVRKESACSAGDPGQEMEDNGKCDRRCVTCRKKELSLPLFWNGYLAQGGWIRVRFLTGSSKNLFRTSDIFHSEYRNLGCRATISFFLCGVTSRPFWVIINRSQQVWLVAIRHQNTLSNFLTNAWALITCLLITHTHTEFNPVTSSRALLRVSWQLSVFKFSHWLVSIWNSSPIIGPAQVSQSLSL